MTSFRLHLAQLREQITVRPVRVFSLSSPINIHRPLECHSRYSILIPDKRLAKNHSTIMWLTNLSHATDRPFESVLTWKELTDRMSERKINVDEWRGTKREEAQRFSRGNPEQKGEIINVPSAGGISKLRQVFASDIDSSFPSHSLVMCHKLGTTNFSFAKMVI